MVMVIRFIEFVIALDRYVGTQSHGIAPKHMLKLMKNTSKQFLMPAGVTESQLDLI